MAFNEDSRVKIPSILHLTRLGYTYLSLKGALWDESTNIFPALFRESVAKINPKASADDIDRLLQEITLLLGNEDKSVLKAYGAFGTKNMYGKEVQGVIRSTFVLDGNGVITHALYNVKATGHVAMLREKLGV
jgi:type I site-specific restriction-modification system R (restriction) subunit